MFRLNFLKPHRFSEDMARPERNDWEFHNKLILNDFFVLGCREIPTFAHHMRHPSLVLPRGAGQGVDHLRRIRVVNA